MRITIIYDNTSYKKELESDWGFSCLVEVKNRRILFDTGTKGRLLLDNMKKLNINPEEIDEVFISHAHFDHTGGLSEFLAVNKKAKVYVPISFHGLKNREVVKIDKPIKIHENIFSTGELNGIEQSMVVKTEKGLVVIVGCSHPGVESILKRAEKFGKPYILIGGLHGFNKFEILKDLEMVCPTHCTQNIREIRERFPKKYLEGGAGRIINI